MKRNHKDKKYLIDLALTYFEHGERELDIVWRLRAIAHLTEAEAIEIMKQAGVW